MLHHVQHRFLADAEGCGKAAQALAARVPRSHVAGRRSRQLCVVMSLAGYVAGPGAPFLPSVGGIVCRGSEEQVLGPNASGIVAGVANVQAVGDRPVVQFPRQAMRAEKAVASAAALDDSVSADGRCAAPFPATVAFLNAAPEARG